MYTLRISTQYLHATLDLKALSLLQNTLYYIHMCTGQRSSVKNHNPVSSPNKTGSARKIAALRQKLHGEKVSKLCIICSYIPFPLNMNN